jgi:hypothetical protein
MLKMEALCSSDVSADLCQTTRRDSPQDGNLHSDRRENLKCRTVSIDKQGLILYVCLEMIHEFDTSNLYLTEQSVRLTLRRHEN